MLRRGANEELLRRGIQEMCQDASSTFLPFSEPTPWLPPPFAPLHCSDVLRYFNFLLTVICLLKLLALLTFEKLVSIISLHQLFDVLHDSCHKSMGGQGKVMGYR